MRRGHNHGADNRKGLRKGKLNISGARRKIHNEIIQAAPIEIREELLESVSLAQAADVANERIILDPGIGFGKTVEQNLELIDRLDEIRSLGYPVLLGASRKGFIGYTLNLPPNQRMEGTAAAVAIGIDRGADIIRVHDVMEMVRVARMTDAIVRSKH